MGRIKNGWNLTKKAWGVVRANPGLMKLPVTGALLAVLSFLVLTLPGGVLVAIGDENSSTIAYAAGAVLAICGIYLSSFFVIYYNVALAAACNLIFQGQPADNKAGVAVARERRGVIAKWAAVALIVSMIFNLLRERGGLLGNIAAGLGAAVWGLVTFLIAPVLAFEGLGPGAAIKRSASMFKQKWGEQVTGNVAIGVVTGIAMFLCGLIVVAGVVILATGEAAPVIAGGGLALLGVVGIALVAIASIAVRGVFGVALYRYVADGTAVGPFTAAELESSVSAR